METVDPKTRSFLYPPSIIDAIQTEKWNQLERVCEDRVDELLSLLITVRIDEKTQE